MFYFYFKNRLELACEKAFALDDTGWLDKILTFFIRDSLILSVVAQKLFYSQPSRSELIIHLYKLVQTQRV